MKHFVLYIETYPKISFVKPVKSDEMGVFVR